MKLKILLLAALLSGCEAKTREDKYTCVDGKVYFEISKETYAESPLYKNIKCISEKACTGPLGKPL